MRKPKPLPRVHVVTIAFPDVNGFYTKKYVIETFRSKKRAMRLYDRLRYIPSSKPDVESMTLEVGR